MLPFVITDGQESGLAAWGVLQAQAIVAAQIRSPTSHRSGGNHPHRVELKALFGVVRPSPSSHPNNWMRVASIGRATTTRTLH